MNEAKDEVKEEVRRSKLIRRSQIQNLAARKRAKKREAARSKWRGAVQETLVDVEIERAELEEKRLRMLKLKKIQEANKALENTTLPEDNTNEGFDDIETSELPENRFSVKEDFNVLKSN